MSTTETNSGEQRQIPDEVIAELREAGVSEIFLKVIQTPAEEVGVPRNSARQEIFVYMKYADEGYSSVSDQLNMGGGFFQDLRNLETRTIPWSADPNNREILNHVFQMEYRNQESTGVQDLL